MSRNGHIAGTESIRVRSLAVTVGAGTSFDPHDHSWPQLIYATAGVMTVRTEEGSWVVPPQRAIWMPAGATHDIEMSTAVSMRTLYFRPPDEEPDPCRVLEVGPLLRELILEAVRIGFLVDTDPRHLRLEGVLKDQLRETHQAPLDVRLPRDARTRRVAQRILEDPGTHAPVEELCAGVGASSRTVQRLFRRETGLTLGCWRQRARMIHALRRLAEGESVSAVAFDVGYASASAFIAAFKQTFGTTPARYFSTPATGGEAQRGFTANDPEARHAPEVSAR